MRTRIGIRKTVVLYSESCSYYSSMAVTFSYTAYIRIRWDAILRTWRYVLMLYVQSGTRIPVYRISVIRPGF
jgi:hypothetical protein